MNKKYLIEFRILWLMVIYASSGLCIALLILSYNFSIAFTFILPIPLALLVLWIKLFNEYWWE